MPRGNPKDITGQRFGNLVAIELAEPLIAESGNKYRRWKCKCDCGKTAIVLQSNLVHGRQKSCGCNHFEGVKTHGLSQTRLYKIWQGMKTRCQNVNSPAYQDYGAKGINVCDEWSTFEPFKDWAINNGYTDELTIDRLDYNGNYEPSNCRWATLKEQMNNKSDNIVIECDGESHTLMEWHERTGIAYGTLKNRYKKGWDAERIIHTPVDKTKSHRKPKND